MSRRISITKIRRNNITRCINASHKRTSKHPNKKYSTTKTPLTTENRKNYHINKINIPIKIVVRINTNVVSRKNRTTGSLSPTTSSENPNKE